MKPFWPDTHTLQTFPAAKWARPLSRGGNEEDSRYSLSNPFLRGHISTRRDGGFTLVELMLVIAIITIITAIAIPNLMRTRTSANEATSITTLKAYATAQITFQAGRQGRVTANSNAGQTGYCDNFRNLYYGNPVGDTRNLALISMAFADAYARAPGPAAAATNAVPTTPTASPRHYQGFLFAEPREMIAGPDNRYATDFALLGVPATAGQTGHNAFWLGQQGTVHMTALPIGTAVAVNVELQTPSDPATLPAGMWITL